MPFDWFEKLFDPFSEVDKLKEEQENNKSSSVFDDEDEED